jgi:hypothetical protein
MKNNSMAIKGEDQFLDKLNSLRSRQGRLERRSQSVKNLRSAIAGNLQIRKGDHIAVSLD